MNQPTYYLGIDYHKKFSQITVMDQNGNIILKTQLANEQEVFSSFVKRFPNVNLTAVIEACRNWGYIYDLLDDLGIKTIVAHPNKTRAIAEAKIKTDSIDATTLAHLLRTDLIPKVYIPPKTIRNQKNLLRHRFWLIKQGARTKNRIHNILDRNHIKITDVRCIFTPTGRRIMDKLSLPTIDSNLFKRSFAIFG